MHHNESHRLGEMEIIAITDGANIFSPEIFTNTSADEIDALLAAAGVDALHTNFNAFAIRHGNEVTLVDAGGGSQMGPVGGNVRAGLAQAGIAPDQVTRLVLTHLHVDHFGGAINDDGTAAFANAECILSAEEYAFAAARAEAATGDDMARASLPINVVNAYRPRLNLVADTHEIAPGITIYPLPGHTPGHIGLMLASGGKRLMLVTDIAHVQSVQFAKPDIGVSFDIDPAQAIATRKATLDMLADTGMVFSGGHIIGPGKFGTVARDGAGYRFTPLT